jgi:hypothetical protein
MPQEKKTTKEAPAELALRLREALQNERIIPRFVDSYVIENSRHALQVHASLYRDLLGLLQREALLALTVRALEIFSGGPPGPSGKSRPQPRFRSEVATFRRKFLNALAHQQKWTAGDALDFQTDLQMYEDVLARSSPARRSRGTFEASSHPFVDRCAFLLDSSFLEKARLAASRALSDLEILTDEVAATVLKLDVASRSRASR